MGRKLLFCIVLFSISALFSYAIEVVYTFEPLKPNERLAYQMRGIRTLFLYAHDTQSPYVTRFINSWDNSEHWGMLQFTADRRSCFFTTQDEYSNKTSLYKLNGDDGIVIRLFDTIPRGRFSSSQDGLLILFIGYNDGSDDLIWPEKEGVFSLFETKNGDLLHRFHWTINTAIDSFDLFRNIDGTFTVFYGGEGDVVYAEARIDPFTFKLEVLWDRTNDRTFRPPDRIEGNFFDDIAFQFEDRTLNLERIIFAPWLESNDPFLEPIIKATPFDSPEESLINDASEVNSPEQLAEDNDIMIHTEPSAINSAAHGQNDKNAVFWITGILGLLFMVCCTLAVINRKRKKGNKETTP